MLVMNIDQTDLQIVYAHWQKLQEFHRQWAPTDDRRAIQQAVDRARMALELLDPGLRLRYLRFEPRSVIFHLRKTGRWFDQPLEMPIEALGQDFVDLVEEQLEQSTPFEGQD